ncbi:MAG: tetratricopeptide repeat protein, partial [Candidatus Hydrogenedentota bacterium]
MAKQFDSIQTLLKQVHADTKGVPGPETGPSAEEKAAEERAKLKTAVARFREDVRRDKLVIRRLRKFRREGIYALRPWHWALILTVGPVLIVGFFYLVHFASSVTRSSLAMNDAVNHIMAGRVEAAIERMNRAISLGADPGVVFIRAGNAMMDMNETDSAVEFFDRAAAHSRLADFSLMATASIRAAEILLELGRLDEANKRVIPILEIDQRQRDALIIRGRVFFAQSKFEEAEIAFIQSLERSPNSLTPRYYLRETYLKMGRIEDAREQVDYLLLARLAGVEDITSLLGYADVLARYGDLRRAEELLIDITKRHRRTIPQVLVSLGRLAIENADVVRAQIFADSAVAIAPAAPDGYILRAEIHYERGRLREAINDLNKALTIEPSNAKALYDMGCILFYDLDMKSQALEKFEASVKEGFDGPFVWYNIGATRYLTKNFPGAIDAFGMMPRFVAAANDAKWSLANACLM